LNRTEQVYYDGTDSNGRDGDLKSVTVKQKTGVNYQVVSQSVYTYDLRGNRLTETVKSLDGNTTKDITTRYYYDDQNRLVRTEDALYDAAISLVLHATGTLYNDYGKPIATTNQLGLVTTNLYDLNGNLIETTYPGDSSAPILTPVTVT